MSRLGDNLSAVGGIGRGEDGSITRIGFSTEYFEAVEATRRLMEDAGMTVKVDRVGNIHGVLPGSVPGAKAILMGSHLDSVKCGGMFDGALGVMGAVEAVKRLQDKGITPRHPIEVWGFNMEESSPVGGTFGSRVITGMADETQDGLAEALALYGRTMQDVYDSRVDLSHCKCYLELHVEQGDRLYQEGLEIGVVSGIVGIVRYEVTALGESNHAGTTMMSGRRDAVVAMSKLIAAADARAREIDDSLVLTFGVLNVFPGAGNVIPGKAVALMEMRHMDGAVTDRLYRDVCEIAKGIDTVEFTFREKINKGSTPCDPALIRTIDGVCQKLGYRHVIMPSGAGHDANPMAHKVPVGMVFVPSVKGVSHSGLEWTEPEDVDRGADVLFETLLALDAED